ncbi:hypothetical protein NQD34_013882 [Periophthalmus magnuspinnatus]|nr:hypothetical protein NQD34_013882 [Periophthalmus magnuspinnatus]
MKQEQRLTHVTNIPQYGLSVSLEKKEVFTFYSTFITFYVFSSYLFWCRWIVSVPDWLIHLSIITLHIRRHWGAKWGSVLPKNTMTVFICGSGIAPPTCAFDRSTNDV